jgi:hypothetical protein
VFTELSYTAGKSKCLQVFKLNSGPKKGKNLIAPTADDITTSILKTGGRTARRAVQSNIAAATKTEERNREKRGSNCHAQLQWLEPVELARSLSSAKV